MENKRSIGSWLFKPFQYIAGGRSLIIGIMVLFILALAGFLSNTFFDGVLDIHYGSSAAPSSLGVHLICVFASWLVLSIIMYITALIFNRKVRIVDMSGTLAMAKAPYLIAALVGFIPSLHPEVDMLSLLSEGNVNELNAIMVQLLPAATLSLLVIVPIIVWYVALMYNAYSVSAYVRGARGGVSFTIALIISEIISVIVLPLLIKLL